MKRLAIKDLQEGMEVAKNIYNNEGNLLIKAGLELKEPYIKRLEQLGIESIYVYQKGIPKVEVPTPISEQTKLKTVKTVREITEDIKAKRGINYVEVVESVNNIIKDILADEATIIHLNDIRTLSNQLFFHSTNVAVLAILIALELGYNEMELKKIAAGALLHDIGKILIEAELLEKNNNLNSEELVEFKKHPEYGYETLKAQQEIDYRVAHIAYQHHEKLDGTGYPRGLKEEEFLNFAQIVAVANIYDKLTSDGGDFEQLSPHNALKIMNIMRHNKLNPDYIDALEKHVALYPVGTLLILNTGETALVTEVSQEYISSPIVKVLLDSSGKRVKEEKKIDLAENKAIKIQDVKE